MSAADGRTRAGVPALQRLRSPVVWLVLVAGLAVLLLGVFRPVVEDATVELAVDDVAASLVLVTDLAAAVGGRVTTLAFDLSEDGSGWARVGVQLPVVRAGRFALDLATLDGARRGYGSLSVDGHVVELSERLAIAEALHAAELDRITAVDLALLPADALVPLLSRLDASAAQRDAFAAELASGRLDRVVSEVEVRLVRVDPEPAAGAAGRVLILLAVLLAALTLAGVGYRRRGGRWGRGGGDVD